MDYSKRTLLKAAAVLVADAVGGTRLRALAKPAGVPPNQKVILVISGGIRRTESFSSAGLVNIPHLSGELLQRAIFYPRVLNEGATGHFNSSSSILTGNWQRVDDWGKFPPTTPTIFECLRKQMGVAHRDVWMISSNKALTSHIGASSASGYGPAYGANVVFPKQLLISTVENAMWEGRNRNMADRSKVQSEIEAILQGSNYEGLGWNVFDAAEQLDPQVRPTILDAIAEYVAGGPTSGDELTYHISVGVMRRFAPALLVVSFSDVEVAHFGAYSLHLAGIRSLDRLVYQLWQEIESNRSYKGQTSLIILPEFGRDPDGSTTNGFFNHRAQDESCRVTWMMCLGAAVDRPQVIERPVRHIDVCPTLAALLGGKQTDVLGSRLTELRA